MTERDASQYVPRSLVHQLSEAHAEIERLRAFVERCIPHLSRPELRDEAHEIAMGRANEQRAESK